MRGVTFDSYDFNYSPYENVKSNLIADRMAKNRWGNKFKRLYSQYKDANNAFDFTGAMHNCVGTGAVGLIDDLTLLRDALKELLVLADTSSAKEYSYFAFLWRRIYVSHTNTEYFYLDDTKLTIASSEAVSDEDLRAKSIFLQRNGVGDDAPCFLEPLNSYYDREAIVENALLLTNETGESFGHTQETLLEEGTTFQNIQTKYGVETVEPFLEKEVYVSKFNELFNSLNFETWVKKFVEHSLTVETADMGDAEVISVVFSTSLFLAWIEENLEHWELYLDNLSEQRTGVELELVAHLNLCDTLRDQIGGNAEDIASIWFEFKKVVDAPLLPTPSLNMTPDPEYKWWEEEQFDEIRKKIKNFENLFELKILENDNAGITDYTVYVTIRDDAFKAGGWKWFWIVSSFLQIDTRARKRSFLSSLFSFVLLVVAIYLTAVSGNPAWMKTLVIGTTILNFSGALSAKISLVLTVAMFAYGLYNTNVSTLSGVDIFKWAIKNIDMVMKMVAGVEALGYETNKKEEEPNIQQQQEDNLNYIYTDAYSQYDTLYNFLYEPEVFTPL